MISAILSRVSSEADRSDGSSQGGDADDSRLDSGAILKLKGLFFLTFVNHDEVIALLVADRHATS